MLLPLFEAYRYLNDSTRLSLEDFETSNFQVLKEIDHYRRLFNLQPEMIVSYDRHAFHGIYDDELRVTCDLNLRCRNEDRKSTRLNSSHVSISYAVFCLKKKR